MQDMNKNWYAVITAAVLYDQDLSPREKLLVAVIANMSNERGYCFASNAHLSEVLKCSDRTIRRDLETLEGKKYIGRVVNLKPNGEVDYRALTVIENIGTPRTPVTAPPDTSDHIITYINKDVDKGKTVPVTSNTTSPLKIYVTQLEEEYTNGSGWIESMLMNNRMGIKTLDAWRKVVLHFAHHQKSHEAVSETYREFKSHFRHWVAHNSTKTKYKDWYL